MVSSLLADDGVPFLAFNCVMLDILGNTNSFEIIDLVDGAVALEGRKALDGAFPAFVGAGRGHQAAQPKINPNAMKTTPNIFLHVRFV